MFPSLSARSDRVFRLTLVCTLALASSICGKLSPASAGPLPLSADASYSSRTGIRYSIHPKGDVQSIVFCTGHRSDRYVVTLEPQLDVQQHVIVLFIFLRGVHDSRYTNLLAPNVPVPGYQKYTFSARDFLNGARRSIFGRTRLITVRKLGIKVELRINKTSVEKINDTAAQFKYEFREFDVNVLIYH